MTSEKTTRSSHQALPTIPLTQTREIALKGPKKARSKAEAAFQRGLTALTQWVEQEGKRPVPRSTVAEITEDGEAMPVKLGVWLSNTKSRRGRLDADQLAALASLGMEWAGAVQAVKAASEPPAPQPAPSAAPKKRRAREHHEECDEELYEGGNCTCWSIERFGPPSEREGYGEDF